MPNEPPPNDPPAADAPPKDLPLDEAGTAPESAACCPEKAIPDPPKGATKALLAYWDKRVHELAHVDVQPLGPEWKERHRIYSLLTFALIDGYFNGNKNGAEGLYPWREGQKVAEGRYGGDQFGDRYIGHNIACIAVDENGELIDFEFNHNELYNSSMEHAESRLVRRVFSLNQVYDHWQAHAAGETRDILYGDVLNGTTIYTSLESCAQCTGIMTLASALRVVYLQSDPTQYLVGNMIYNLSRPPPEPVRAKLLAVDDWTRPKPQQKFFAPEPLDAGHFDFEYKMALDEAYLRFAIEGKDTTNDKFWYKSSTGPEKRTDGVTSFLCTDLAREIFRKAAADFAAFVPKYGDFRPTRSDNRPAFHSNAYALEHARAFLNHALKEARRGTPHR